MTVEIRPPRPDEMPEVGKLAALMVTLHHEMNPRRFLDHGPVAEGYARFLTRMAAEPGAVVLVARDDEGIAGYVYGRMEAHDWNRLLDAHGKIHDIVVAERARRRGYARQLMQAAMSRLTGLGAVRILLDTAQENESAQQLFKSLGFAPTMIEMMIEP